MSVKDHFIPNPNYQDIFIFLTIPIIVLKPATRAHNLVTDELGGMREELKTSWWRGLYVIWIMTKCSQVQISFIWLLCPKLLRKKYFYNVLWYAHLYGNFSNICKELFTIFILLKISRLPQLLDHLYTNLPLGLNNWLMLYLVWWERGKDFLT